MSGLHDVIHTLIDLASGAQARLAPHEAAALHEAIDFALAEATKLDGPDVSHEPAPAEVPAQRGKLTPEQAKQLAELQALAGESEPAQPEQFPASPPYGEPYAPPAPADVFTPASGGVTNSGEPVAG